MDTSALTCNTDDMFVIHRLLRRVFTDAPVLVRGVAEGEVTRAAIVADHVQEIAAGLHAHHHTEDEFLWDKLESRSPGCALHVGQMRAQHAEAAALITELRETLPAWRAGASGVDRERVAAVLDELLATLLRHLGQEEDQILPIAQVTMSQAEWDVLGEHGRASVPRDRQFIQLGMLLDAFDDPAERQAWMRANLPVPVRVLFSLVGRRQFEAHRAKVYGLAG
ncbi:hemerythrin domain-containing protein [Occultella kanbiaonis]|uniref:hemerythrin domain-containing protein n=1 Tax=Occultella kanbiaonis TaxID=2675754 RepID=UPI0013D25D4F|nr:hemerythrin domain-containing protein [Occultella kanbiaonis]